jgi:hypothetical protein
VWVEWDQLATQQYQPLFQPLRQLVARGYVPSAAGVDPATTGM